MVGAPREDQIEKTESKVSALFEAADGRMYVHAFNQKRIIVFFTEVSKVSKTRTWHVNGYRSTCPTCPAVHNMNVISTPMAAVSVGSGNFIELIKRVIVDDPLKLVATTSVQKSNFLVFS